ncbi:hypothetical protein [Lichenicoccus sp.]|uniref:hypothetical protein n=1 Tax=Lichenicoccus sp. TaxID=2781899 RepID=UPI003D0FA9C3
MVTTTWRASRWCAFAVLVPLAGLIVPSPSHAAPSGWTASGCGHEPAPPMVESESVEKYNASIDRVGAYDRAARAYSACVNHQAGGEQTAISNDARARMAVINAGAASVQKRIAGNFAALSAQLHSAGQKLGAK